MKSNLIVKKGDVRRSKSFFSKKNIEFQENLLTTLTWIQRFLKVSTKIIIKKQL
jgi:hypothetical protein